MMRHQGIVVLGLLLSLLSTQGRPLAPGTKWSATSAAQVSFLHRALLSEGDGESGDVSTWLQEADLERFTQWYNDNIMGDAVELVTQLNGLGRDSRSEVIAALRRVGDAVLPPLMDSLKARRNEVQAYVDSVRSRLPPNPTRQDVTDRVSSPQSVPQLFKLVKEVLTAEALGAMDVAFRVLTGDIYEIMDGADMLPSGSPSRAATLEDAMARFAKFVTMISDEAGFKRALDMLLAGTFF